MSYRVRSASLFLLLAMVLPTVLTAFPAWPAEASLNGHANVYVDAARPDDSGNGLSWATAKKTINAGVDLVDPEGTVHVAAGTYREAVLLDKDCTLSGAGALVTFIDGGGTMQAVRASGAQNQGNTITGFTIQNGYVGGSMASGMLGNGMPVGGGVYVDLYHQLMMEDCSIVNNYASFMGGGILNKGQLLMLRCTVSGNTAGMIGGGIANYSDEGQTGIMDLANCTVSGNSITGTSIFPPQMEMPFLGGGILNGGVAAFWNVTVAGNSVPTGAYGGGIANVPIQCNNENPRIGSVKKNLAVYKNTIVANNVADNCYNDVETVVQSLGNNLDSQDNCGFNGSYDQVNTNPLLGPLKNNGGPTSTMAICTNSPAYNRGSSDNYYPYSAAGMYASADSPPLDTDQRGVARPQAGAWDIGSFEMVPISVTTVGADAGFTSATFHGNLNSGIGGAPVYVYFQYGANPGVYTGQTLQQGMAAVGSFSAFASGLPMGACYYRAVAVGDCVAYGIENRINFGLLQNNAGGTGFGIGMGPSNDTNPWTPTGAPVSLAAISVTSASLSVSGTSPGVPVTVTADVANKGTVNGTMVVKLYVNGQEEASKGVLVGSGARVPVTFTFTRNEPGSYSVYVGGVSAGSFTVEDAVSPNVILFCSIGLIMFALVAIVLLRRRRVV